MEMPRPWTSQSEAHRRLEISLENARFPHSHSRVFLTRPDDEVSPMYPV
jgi:hypothetical protein